jgi:hypothetical protein
MLDPFGVSFSSFDGYTHRDKYIHDEPMAGSCSRRQLLPAFRQKNTTIGAGRCQPFPLQPGNGLDRGGMGNAKAASNICRTRLARAGQQVSDKFDVVLKQSSGLGRTSFARRAWVSSAGSFDRCSCCIPIALRDIVPPAIATMTSPNFIMR